LSTGPKGLLQAFIEITMQKRATIVKNLESRLKNFVNNMFNTPLKVVTTAFREVLLCPATLLSYPRF
jgi:hypothetical protein